MSSTHPLAAKPRIASLDILRGLVMVIMALDHLRDMYALYPYPPEDISQTFPGLFFTRWITHYCAPVFVFLAGTSIFLFQQKAESKQAVSRMLLTRGLWLIVVEILIINWAWSWHFFWNSSGFFLQVIWVIGISMVLMAALIWLPKAAILAFSLVLIFGHNLLDGVDPEQLGQASPLGYLLHQMGGFGLGESKQVFVVYPIIPWIGVMGAGYVFGEVMQWDATRRKRMLLALGGGAIALFVVLRGLNGYGDPYPWESQGAGVYTLMSFLNVAKYPPSLDFLLMTLGPALLLLLAFEGRTGKVGEWLRVYGRVPFFFYILHLIIPHAASMFYWWAVSGHFHSIAINGFGATQPEWYQPSLLRLYLIWAFFIIVLYFPCRWFMRYKGRHRYWWLQYL